MVHGGLDHVRQAVMIRLAIARVSRLKQFPAAHCMAQLTYYDLLGYVGSQSESNRSTLHFQAEGMFKAVCAFVPLHFRNNPALQSAIKAGFPPVGFPCSVLSCGDPRSQNCFSGPRYPRTLMLNQVLGRLTTGSDLLVSRCWVFLESMFSHSPKRLTC